MPRISLTFDDGPGPSTPALLDVLGRHQVRATFFLLGANIEARRDVAIRVAREGHVLGNHTYSHARPDAITPDALVAEIARTDALLESVAQSAGAALRSPVPLRLPYGVVAADPRVAVLAQLGRASTGWTADVGDWEPADAEELAARMEAHVRAQHASGQDVVLDLHDASRTGAARPWTVHAVRLVIERLGAGAFSALA